VSLFGRPRGLFNRPASLFERPSEPLQEAMCTSSGGREASSRGQVSLFERPSVPLQEVMCTSSRDRAASSRGFETSSTGGAASLKNHRNPRVSTAEALSKRFRELFKRLRRLFERLRDLHERPSGLLREDESAVRSRPIKQTTA
jgi:hypothetical protein